MPGDPCSADIANLRTRRSPCQTHGLPTNPRTDAFFCVTHIPCHWGALPTDTNGADAASDFGLFCARCPVHRTRFGLDGLALSGKPLSLASVALCCFCCMPPPCLPCPPPPPPPHCATRVRPATAATRPGHPLGSEVQPVRGRRTTAIPSVPPPPPRRTPARSTGGEGRRQRGAGAPTVPRTGDPLLLPGWRTRRGLRAWWHPGGTARGGARLNGPRAAP